MQNLHFVRNPFRAQWITPQQFASSAPDVEGEARSLTEQFGLKFNLDPSLRYLCFRVQTQVTLLFFNFQRIKLCRKTTNVNHTLEVQFGNEFSNIAKLFQPLGGGERSTVLGPKERRTRSGYQRGSYRGQERSYDYIDVFRHPLGNPSNPDLSPRALGCIHIVYNPKVRLQKKTANPVASQKERDRRRSRGLITTYNHPIISTDPNIHHSKSRLKSAFPRTPQTRVNVIRLEYQIPQYIVTVFDIRVSDGTSLDAPKRSSLKADKHPFEKNDAKCSPVVRLEGQNGDTVSQNAFDATEAVNNQPESCTTMTIVERATNCDPTRLMQVTEKLKEFESVPNVNVIKRHDLRNPSIRHESVCEDCPSYVIKQSLVGIQSWFPLDEWGRSLKFTIGKRSLEKKRGVTERVDEEHRADGITASGHHIRLLQKFNNQKNSYKNRETKNVTENGPLVVVQIDTIILTQVLKTVKDLLAFEQQKASKKPLNLLKTSSTILFLQFVLVNIRSKLLYWFQWHVDATPLLQFHQCAIILVITLQGSVDVDNPENRASLDATLMQRKLAIVHTTGETLKYQYNKMKAENCINCIKSVLRLLNGNTDEHVADCCEWLQQSADRWQLSGNSRCDLMASFPVHASASIYLRFITSMSTCESRQIERQFLQSTKNNLEQIYHEILSSINKSISSREKELDQRMKGSKTLHGSLARLLWNMTRAKLISFLESQSERSRFWKLNDQTKLNFKYYNCGKTMKEEEKQIKIIHGATDWIRFLFVARYAEKKTANGVIYGASSEDVQLVPADAVFNMEKPSNSLNSHLTPN
ncbi:hypothetical protein WN51_05822 [Melipona quadrifasciata]|uniref:Uncharacterized protein n=1 Tax=Melipona quadrifasciata TaxID=166423 RepID=A0A0M9A601_9HYME|nr:hypothetical protein WN51_05822 [Melipona quadrifasciata]